jgi:spore germination cell wall hydrolase CwlJ-like protein
MKNKYIYIIVLLLTVLICLSVEIQHQTATKQISTLTAQNITLQQDIAALQTTADKQDREIGRLTKEIAQLKAQPKPETQKISRSADRPRYNLTGAERDLVERVVMAESGGESYKGQMLVAQCILNACEIDGISPAKVIKKYVYAKARPKPSDSVKRAVSAVFDKGEQVTDEPIVYFYAPALVRSEFHESQIFAIEEGGHRFFVER